jgi:deazaflavin-dependent oxidoreductase (nitroreductase family)
MPIPKRVRRWNKVAVNRVTRRIAPRLPGFGVVVHRGRRSGRLYETPVSVFHTADGYLVALTYGPDTDWVKNVLAAGRCELRTRGRTVQLESSRLFHDESRRGVPPVIRQGLRIIRAADFLSLEPAHEATRPGQTG